ncbi:MAG: DUF2339 domain-containing protein [Bacillota bacterium]
MEDDPKELSERLSQIDSRLSSIEQRLESVEGSLQIFPRHQARDKGASARRPGGSSLHQAYREWETAIGGTWLNRIGVIAFILGVGFFLKYAFDNQWIGPLGRVVLGISAGLGFLLGGEHLQSRGYARFAQGLTGGGIAILYLSLFAAFNYYGLLSQALTFALMIQVTVVSVVLAVRNNSSSIAFLGVLGGFITPLLLGRGAGGSTVLLVYILLLDLGVLGVLYFRKWTFLNYFGFAGSYLYLIYSILVSGLGQGERMLFIVLFFLLFTAVPLAFNLANRQPARPRDIVLVALNSLLFYGLVYHTLPYQWLGTAALCVGLFYLVLNTLIARMTLRDTHLETTFLITALVFFILAVPVQLTRQWVTLAWSLQLVVLYWQGLKLGNLGLRAISYLLLPLAMAYQWSNLAGNWHLYGYLKPAAPFINQDFIISLVLVAAAFTLPFLGSRLGERVLKDEERGLLAVTGIVANLLLLGLASREISLYFGYRISLKQVSLSALWASYSLFLMALGILRHHRASRLLAMALFGVTIAKVFLVDLSSLEPVFRIVAFTGLGLVLIAASFMYQRRLKAPRGKGVGEGNE